jgi:hypothetical protein
MDYAPEVFLKHALRNFRALADAGAGMKLLSNPLLLAVFLLAQAVTAQATASHYDPSSIHQGRQQKSFLEFALGQVNPENANYGQCIEDARRIGIESTIVNYYFWSNAVAMTAVPMLSCYAVLLTRRRRHELLKAARVLAQYHNQHIYEEEKYQSLRAKYLQLQKEIEQELKYPPKASATKSRSVFENRDNGKDTRSSTTAAVGVAAVPLEQQVFQANQTVATLRQQMTTLTQRLEAEQQKNRKLRGE